MKVSAVIPAKGSSKRISAKNLRELNGCSLIERKIIQLLGSKLIDEVCVGSDSIDILKIAESSGAKPIKRDDYHCNEDLASANEMIYDLVSKVEADIIVWVHCTNPFIDSFVYDAGVKCFHNNFPNYDSLVSVTKMSTHFWFDGSPLNFNPKANKHQLASTLEPLYYQNGGFFIQEKNNFLKNSYFYGDKPFLYEIDENIGLDINTMADLNLARAILNLTPNLDT
jgi:CMP-N-acetylneuraminic acid synthetase